MKWLISAMLYFTILENKKDTSTLSFHLLKISQLFRRQRLSHSIDQRFEIVFVSPASAIDKTMTLIGHSVVPPSWNGCEAESSILWHRTNVNWWSCYIIKIKGWSLIEGNLSWVLFTLAGNKCLLVELLYYIREMS